jgi:hypothetical protein
MKRTVILVGMIIAFALIAFPAMAGGLLDMDSGGSGGSRTTTARNAASFEGTWVSASYQESYESPAGSGNLEKENSKYTFWINDDGEAIVECNYIHWHFAPMYGIRGNTLVITTGDAYEDTAPREVYATFRIEGDTLVRVMANRTEHIYRKN